MVYFFKHLTNILSHTNGLINGEVGFLANFAKLARAHN